MAETKLRGRKEEFCQQYTLCYEGKKAAILAGYAEKSAAKQASMLLKETAVVERIREIQKELAERTMLTRERIVMELLDVLAICKAAKPVEVWSYTEHRMVETGEYQIDSKGAAKALELLGRHLGMFDKRDDDSGAGGPVYITGEDEIKE